MPILLILFVTAACLPISWPAPPAGVSPYWAVFGTSVLTLLPILTAAVASCTTTAKLARDTDLRSVVIRQFNRLRRLVLFLNLSCFLASLIGLGWAWVVWHTVIWDGKLFPFAEVLIPAPFLLAMCVNWIIYYPADRAIHNAAGFRRPFPGWFAHWFAQARRFVLFVLFPAVLFTSFQTINRFAPKEWLDSPWFYFAGLGVTATIFVCMPVAMKRVLGMQSFPAGPRRDRFEALARRLNVRFGDILIWPTHGSLATAVMLGVAPRFRYCAFTDRLLEELNDDELDAVFGHEIGHVKHGHVPFYLLFFIFSSAVISTAVAAGVQALGIKEEADIGMIGELLLVAPLVALGSYLFVVFGWLSRKCERQADLYGARVMSCGRTDCAVHDAADYPIAGLAPMCPTGIRVFVNALQQVAFINGLDAVGGEHTSLLQTAWAWVRAWQHGPIPARIAFLRSLLLDPRRERTAQQRITLGRWGLIAGLAVATILLGSTVGWTVIWSGL